MSVRKNDCSAGVSAGGEFGHPVFKKLATLNGHVNKMTKDELKEQLAQLHLDTRGLKDVLKTRLKNHYKRKQLTKASIPNTFLSKPYDFFLVIDFEATCDRNIDDYPHEIIEFPAILIDMVKLVQVDEFHSYVKPVLNPHLSDFCTELTGITQDQVNQSPYFPDVLRKMEAWMAGHGLGTRKKFAIVTDGPWDMSRFMYLQCLRSAIPFPRWARKWVNVRKAFVNGYQVKKANLLAMLENFGLAFEGRPHSGIDDTRNIAIIVTHMAEDGCALYVNERIYPRKLKNCDGSTQVFSIKRGARESSSDEEDKDEETIIQDGLCEPDRSQKAENVGDSDAVNSATGSSDGATTNPNQKSDADEEMVVQDGLSKPDRFQKAENDVDLNVVNSSAIRSSDDARTNVAQKSNTNEMDATTGITDMIYSTNDDIDECSDLLEYFALRHS